MNFNSSDNKVLAAIMVAIFGSNVVMCITALLLAKPFKRTVNLVNDYLELGNKKEAKKLEEFKDE